MPITVSPFEVDVTCPGNLSVGQDGAPQATMTAMISNDGPDDVTVSYSISLVDSDGNSGANSDAVLVPAGGSQPVSSGAFFNSTYTSAGQRTVTGTATANGETKSTICTFSVI